MTQPSPVALRIRQTRESQGLTQAALAARLGVTRSQITLWETGARNPSPTSLKEIAVTLGVQVEWLVTGQGAPKPSPATSRGVDAQLHELVVEAVQAAFKRRKLDTNSKRFTQVVVMVYAMAVILWASPTQVDTGRFREYLLVTAELALGA